MRLKKTLLVATCLYVAVAIHPLPAAEKLDLERITPVASTERIPVTDFFRPLLLQQPKLNPSGTHIAAIVTAAEDRHQLLVYELKTQKFQTVGGLGEKDVHAVHWLDDRRLVFELAARKLYGVSLLAAEVGSLSQAYPLLQYYNSTLLAVPPQNRLRPLVTYKAGLDDSANFELAVGVINTDIKNGRNVNLIAVDTDMAQLDYTRENNERHILKTFPTPKSGLITRYYADKEGQLEFSVTVKDGVLTLHHLVGDQWQKCPVDLEHIDLIGAGDEPGQFVVAGPRQEGKPRALQFMNGATGELGEVLLQDKAYDFDGGLYRDPVTHRVIGASFERNGPHVVWFNEDYKSLQKVMNGFFPGVVAHIIGSDEAQKLFLVSTYTDRQPVIYNWVDLENHAVGLIKRSAPWIDAARMQPMNVIKFKTRDGRQLDAYLTMPAGASKKNPPPMVVLPHDGPWIRDSWGFQSEVQFFANRGYAVLQPNYRGSDGYDWMFPEEDRWDFAKMSEDVTDATKAVVASGLVDGGRIAILGTSFGGYLAISGVTQEPALYHCAATIDGVFDWEKYIQDRKYNQFDSSSFGRLMYKLGDPKQQPAKFDAISPGRRVDRIRVPVFVAGGKDFQSSRQQSGALISELEKYHLPHESYIVSEEGGMEHLANRVELYTRIEAFLAKNLMPAKTAVAAAGSP